MTLQPNSVVCYVALGSNLGNPENHIMDGLKALADHSDIYSLSTSLFYQSKPYGPQNQPDYINAAVVFETALMPEILLDELQKIENKNGRIRKGVERWGARTLDLDLLFYGDETISTKRLTVPHPRICERAFVLYPLRDLVRKQGLRGKQDLKITEKATLNDCIDMLSTEAKNEIKEYTIND